MANISSVLYLIIIATIFTNATAVNYCNLKSCSRRGSHTMCKYTSPKPAAACGRVIVAKLTTAEKAVIVRKHNKLRQFVASGKESRGNPGPQPPAAYMPNLVWDNELEQIAQRWANQCASGHDSCRNVERFHVGQNIASYSSGSNGYSVDKLVQLWYDEVTKFNRNKVSKFVFVPAVGHYTQVVWADTTKIGCGLIQYKKANDKYVTKSLVCNYGPSGNYRGKKIYSIKQIKKRKYI